MVSVYSVAKHRDRVRETRDRMREALDRVLPLAPKTPLESQLDFCVQVISGWETLDIMEKVPVVSL